MGVSHKPGFSVNSLAPGGTAGGGIMAGLRASREANLKDFNMQTQRLLDGVGQSHPIGIWVDLSVDMPRLRTAQLNLKTEDVWLFGRYLLKIMALESDVALTYIKLKLVTLRRHKTSASLNY